MGTPSGEATLSYFVCLPSKEGSTLNGMNLLYQEQILLSVDLILKGFFHPGKLTGSHF